MRLTTLLAPVLGLALLLPLAPRARAADPADADSAAILAAAALADLNAPGSQHRRLAGLAGKWSATYRMRPRVDAPPVEFPGTAVYRMDLGGLFLIGESALDFGELKGRALVVYGFDRIKNRFTFLYIQDHDTQMLTGFGVPARDGKSVVFDVAVDEPAQGHMGRHYRTVLSFDTPDQHTFSMSQTLPDGRNYTPLEIVFTRVP